MHNAQLIETPTDFRDSMSGLSFQHHTLLKPPSAIEPEFRHAVDAIFADLPYISRDEPELVASYLNSIEEPLRSLSSLGFVLLAVTTKGTWKSGDGTSIPNWTNTHYFITTKGSFFSLGDELDHPIHRFDPDCDAFVRDLLAASTKPLPCSLYGSKQAVLTAYERAVPWCPMCCLSEME